MNVNFDELKRKVANISVGYNGDSDYIESTEIEQTSVIVKNNEIVLEKIDISEIIKALSLHIPTLLQAVEDGIADTIETFSKLKKAEFVITSNVEKLKDKAIDYIESRGVKNEELKPYNLGIGRSGDVLDYEKDTLYNDLKNKLKERENQLKNAYQSKDIAVFYDPDSGEQIPIVPIKTLGKPYIKFMK